MIAAAALGDRLGRRCIHTLGLLLSTTASAACALAPDTGTLMAFRAVRGTGTSWVVASRSLNAVTD